MRLASRDGENWREEQRFRLFRLLKRVRQFVVFRPHQPRRVLFVVGCQRSGTSLLAHIFRKDWNVVSFDEISPLSSRDPEGLRWNSLPEVRERLLGCRAGMVVAKPLVETQRLSELLDAIPDSRAVWMYRGVDRVASSNLKFFGAKNGHADLAPVLAGDPANWRSEGTTPQQRETIRELAEAGLGDLDAAALFWWLRNSLFFQGRHQGDERVMVLDYDDLLADAESAMRRCYTWLEEPFPGGRIVADVLPPRASASIPAKLSLPVRQLCADLDIRFQEQLSRFR